MMHKAWSNIGEAPYCFSRSFVKFEGHKGQKIADFDPSWAFETVTPVSIHPCLWNDAHSLMWYRPAALLFFKVIHQILRSHRTKKSPILTWIERFWTVTEAREFKFDFNDGFEMMHKCWHRSAVLFFEVIHQISHSHGLKSQRFESNLRLLGRSQLSNPSDLPSLVAASNSINTPYLSVGQSVCLSVSHTFLTMFPSSYHHEIFRSYYQW